MLNVVPFFNIIPYLKECNLKCPQCGTSFDVSVRPENKTWTLHILECSNCKQRITGRTADEIFSKLDFLKQRTENPNYRSMKIEIFVNSIGKSTRAEVWIPQKIFLAESLLALNALVQKLDSQFSDSLSEQTLLNAVTRSQFKYDDTIVCQNSTPKEAIMCLDSESPPKHE